MRKLILTGAMSLIIAGAFAQQSPKYSTYYYQRASLFEQLPVASDDIVFIGNSITDGGEWTELFQDGKVKNRGISGDICMGVYDRLEPILKGKPAKIFLLIGINDVSRGTPADTIVSHIDKIAQRIGEECPETELYLQSILPVTDHYNMFGGHTSRWEMIPYINSEIQTLCKEKGLTYIDLFSHFVDPATGKMNPAYTNDGLHLLGNAYVRWVEIVKPYVFK